MTGSESDSEDDASLSTAELAGVDVEDELEDAADDVGVPDGDGTPADEALARPSYHLERARSHVERALESIEREVIDEPSSFDVMEGVSVFVTADGEVQVGIEQSAVRALERDEALLLGQVLRVATEPERGAEVLTYEDGVDRYHGP